MIIILAILAATRASPVTVGLQSPPLLSLGQLQSPSCDDPNGCRSLWDIIRSCALTLFLCTWVSIHPNIPSPDERWPRIALRRVGLMLAALTVPEAIVMWALRQRAAAVSLAREHKQEGWTITHGFFATMGGFMEYEGNRPVRVLLPEDLRSYSLTGNGDFPRMSKTEIEDKSKGDFISKALVVLQTGWFVVQCIARAGRGLPITELELVTVAFAALNLAIYLLWWDKPLNVKCGVRVYKKRSTEEPVDDGDVVKVTKVVKFVPHLVRFLLLYLKKLGVSGFFTDVPVDDAATRMTPELLIEVAGGYERLQFHWQGSTNVSLAIVRGPLREASWPWPVRVLYWPFFKPFEIIIGNDENHEKRVNTFYPGLGHYIGGFTLAIIVTAIASAFGGIHCIGWLFKSPSSTEQTLWRVASVSIAGVPVVLSLVTYAGEIDLDRYIGSWSFAGISYILLFLYILSRLVLLVLPFLCLRSLPPAAYHVVHWTSFIPHI
ncbi:hypothetical protein BC827DRAFT_1145267 [Russula dissimulans]|nr:hypothetical protein BC827DRAFT_1145267 [Russula dissimulans]